MNQLTTTVLSTKFRKEKLIPVLKCEYCLVSFQFYGSKLNFFEQNKMFSSTKQIIVGCSSTFKLH